MWGLGFDLGNVISLGHASWIILSVSGCGSFLLCALLDGTSEDFSLNISLKPWAHGWPIKSLLILLCVCCLIVSGCATVGAGTQGAVLRTKDKVAPALVHIRPVKEVFSRGQRREVSILGSGFIISADGYVVTNEHVAGESTSVKCVMSNKEEVDAVVVGVDPLTDIAVLKLDLGDDLPFVEMGDSDKNEAGQTVLALGSPHGLARSVSLGIISVTDRHLASRGSMVSPFNNWIQTDAAINPGNSGGPLVNLRGEVIGVNARVLTGAENVGFAIPINIVKEVVAQIIEYGHVKRSHLGFSLQETLARTDDPTQLGVVISDVDPLYPGAAAGIVAGDILVAINGELSNARFGEDLPVLRKKLADLPVGEAVALTVSRGGEEMIFHVAPSEESLLIGEQLEFEAWGFTGRGLTPAIVRRAQLASDEGIIVSGRRVGSVAQNAKLNVGDIVLKMDGVPLRSLDDFSEKYDRLVSEQKAFVLLWVKNQALTRFVLVKQYFEEEADAKGEESNEE